MAKRDKEDSWLKRNAIELLQLIVSLFQWLWPYLSAYFLCFFAWFKITGLGFVKFLSTPFTIPVWGIMILAFLLVILIAYFVRSQRIYYQRIPPEQIPISLFAPGRNVEIWGVLWTVVIESNKQNIRGPDCPDHLLRMRIIEGKNKFLFECPGEEGKQSHSIEGPSPIQLALGRKASLHPRVKDLREDVRNRMISAVKRQEQLINRIF